MATRRKLRRTGDRIRVLRNGKWRWGTIHAVSERRVYVTVDDDDKQYRVVKHSECRPCVIGWVDE